MSDKLSTHKKKTSMQETNEHEKSTAAGSVRCSSIQALTGFALLNLIEKTRALCFYPTRTDMQKCRKQAFYKIDYMY